MNKFFGTIVILLVLVAALTSFVFLVQDNKASEAKPVTTDDVENDDSEDQVEREPEPIVEEIKPIVTTATLAGVGDILIHSTLFKDAYKSDGTYDFRPMFELVKPYIQQADIAFANQETVLGGTELGLSGYPLFNSPYEVGDALIDTGFDVVSIANNHTLDVREKGLLNSINYYKSIDLIYTGAYESEEDRLMIRTIERNDIVFSFLAYTYGTNGIPVPEGKDYLVNLIDVDRINDEIIRAKEISDVVVLSLHFGGEYQPYPNETQKQLANEFAATGADVIFGHHPHVLQPMEWIEQEDGRKTFVAYSLGNFLSGQIGTERLIGGIAQLEVEKTVLGDDVTVELREPKFLPVYTYYRDWRNFKLHPMQEIESNNILNNFEKHLEETKQHISQWMPELSFDF